MLKPSHPLRLVERSLPVLLALGWLAPGASAQVHRPAERNPLGDQLGMSLAFVGDVDGDGKGDFVAGALRSSVGQPGYVVAVSGATGAALRRVNGAIDDDYFGIAVGGGGDLDGDGVGDFAVGAVNWKTRVRGEAHAYVRVFSGSSGEMLLHVAAPADSGLFGHAVTLIADVNGDGRRDVAVAAPALDMEIDGRLGELIVCSGADGTALHRVQGESRRDEFATSLAPIRDLNGDGVDDLLVGAPGLGSREEDGGYVRGICGATGQTIFTVRGSVRQGGLGAGLASGADLDGDSVEDFVATFSRSGKASTHAAQAFSGATRQRIAFDESNQVSTNSTSSVALLRSPSPNEPIRILLGQPLAATGRVRLAPLEGQALAFDLACSLPGGGFNVCAIGDVDSDGFGDFAVGCPWATPSGEPAGPSIGEVLVVSGRSGTVLHRIRGGSGGP